MKENVERIAFEIRGLKFAFIETEKKNIIEQLARSVEALKETYTREDMINFAQECCSNFDYPEIISSQLDQFNAERQR